MTVHTCTRCPLRFVTRAEMVDHLEHDHHLPSESFEQISYPSAHKAEPLYRARVADDGIHTVLLIANQTLDSTVVDDLMRQRQEVHGDRLTVFVSVPATPSRHLLSWDGGPVGQDYDMDSRADDAGLAHARWQLRVALGVLSDLGVVAHGSVGDPNPMVAAARVIEKEPIDEILVSTLEKRLSRWLKADLPASLKRRFDLPVTTLVASAVAS